MEYLCGFIIESLKRQRNCSISGEVHLLPVRNITQAKKKLGKKPSLSIENCLFLTFIRLRVGLTETDLAFCFQVSQSLISRILAT